MKFTLSWLEDHLKTQAPLDEIAAALSTIGLEVESIYDPAVALGAFKVARIVDVTPHPNADRLQVVHVEIEKGRAPVEVVCGAPNAREGLVGVFAPLGTYIPGSGFTLEKRPVRGVVSNGMLCSAAELQLSDESEAIIELPASMNRQIGERYIDAAGLNDPVIDVSVTPNRPDCTGVRGIARDLAAAGLGTLKPERRASKVEGTFDCPVDVKLEFSTSTANACPVFAARYVKGVRNRASPQWMQNRLRAIGLRPINALVDVTNYVAHDRGRPLHVYDADKLKGAIRARLGETGEKFLALDGKEYEVDETMCVIADESGPLGLGGVIGGESSGSTLETKNVLIESAWFDPGRTAATGRKTGLVTDARYRFERGVDPATVLPGLDLATHWILKLCGGEPSRARIAGDAPAPKTAIEFDVGRVRQLSGMDVGLKEAKRILSALGFELSGKGKTLNVGVPTWRPDVHGTADLVEEIVRIAGLDRIPPTPLPRASGVGRAVLTQTQRRSRRTRQLLASRGLVECITWSFIPTPVARHFGGGGKELELANPISVDMSAMRPSLLPGLLAAFGRNRNRGFADVAIFELGQIYAGDAPENQLLAAAGLRTGTAGLGGSGRHWIGAAQNVTLFDAKADVAAALDALGVDVGRAQISSDAPAWYHPGRSGVLRLGPKIVLAHFGEVHPETLMLLGVPEPIAAFEVFLNALPGEKKIAGRAKAPFAGTDLLPVRRDFAFVLDRSVPASDVVRAAAAADKTLITNVNVFDVFDGGSLGDEGRKSVAIEVTLQPLTDTLTDSEIEAISERIISGIRSATGGEIRS